MRSQGWWTQTHLTFMYWWMNMLQRINAMSAKKWYLRDTPQAQGYTAEMLRDMGPKNIAKNLAGYTSSIPGTKASKSKLRQLILFMVRQIEIETTTEESGAAGSVPCIFGP